MTRIQLEYSDEKAKLLEELKQKLGVRTTKEMFNNALTLLEWYLQEKSNGNAIASVDKKNNTLREILLPTLSGSPKA